MLDENRAMDMADNKNKSQIMNESQADIAY